MPAVSLIRSWQDPKPFPQRSTPFPNLRILTSLDNLRGCGLKGCQLQLRGNTLKFWLLCEPHLEALGEDSSSFVVNLNVSTCLAWYPIHNHWRFGSPFIAGPSIQQYSSHLGNSRTCMYKWAASKEIWGKKKHKPCRERVRRMVKRDLSYP